MGIAIGNLEVRRMKRNFSVGAIPKAYEDSEDED
jgi:hypothetical protein